MTVTTGPGAQPPITISTLRRRLEAAQAAVKRLQINRTPPPTRLGQLTNVDSKMDGSGVSDGQIPIYRKASGTYEPGSGGTSIPTMGYNASPPPSYLYQSGPMQIGPTPGSAMDNAMSSGQPLFIVYAPGGVIGGGGVQGGMAVSWFGNLTFSGFAGGVMCPTAIGNFQLVTDPYPGYNGYAAIGFVAPIIYATEAGAGGGPFQATSLSLSNFSCSLPRFNTPIYQSGNLIYDIGVNVYSVDGNDIIQAHSEMTLGPALNISMIGSNFTPAYNSNSFIYQYGTDLVFPTGNTNQGPYSQSGKPCAVQLTVDISNIGNVVY